MKKLRVMLVDDNIAFLAAEKLFLETLMLVQCVSTATSAQIALQEMPAFTPDLIEQLARTDRESFSRRVART